MVVHLRMGVAVEVRDDLASCNALVHRGLDVTTVQATDHEVRVADTNVDKQIENSNFEVVGRVRVNLVVCLENEESLVVGTL